MEECNLEQEIQYVILPHDMTIDKKLNPKDLLIYCYLRMFRNNTTNECFPSLETLSELSKAAVNTIRKCLSNLEQAGWITITKKGRKNVYSFKDVTEHWEPISYELLKRKDLTFIQKATYITEQQHLIKDEDTMTAVTTFSNRKMADIINMPESTYRKTINELIDKEFVELQKYIDPLTKLTSKQKVYFLDKLSQAIIFIIRDHETRIRQNEEDIEDLKQFKTFILSDNEINNKYQNYNNGK